MSFQIYRYLPKEMPKIFQYAKQKVENAFHYLTDLIKFCSEKFYSSVGSFATILRGRVTNLNPKAPVPTEQPPIAALPSISNALEASGTAAVTLASAVTTNLPPVAIEQPPIAALPSISTARQAAETSPANLASAFTADLPKTEKTIVVAAAKEPQEKTKPGELATTQSPSSSRLGSSFEEMANRGVGSASNIPSLDKEVRRLIDLAKGVFSADTVEDFNQRLLDPFGTSVSKPDL